MIRFDWTMHINDVRIHLFDSSGHTPGPRNSQASTPHPYICPFVHTIAGRHPEKKNTLPKTQIPKTFPPSHQQPQGAPPRTVHSPSHTFGPASALSQIQNGMPHMQPAQDGQPPQMGEVWEEREVSRRVRIHEGGSSTPWVRTSPKPKILELDSWTSGRGKARGI